MSEQPAVIFLDDEAEQLAAIRRMLHSDQFPLHTCATPDEVMQILASEPVGVVISDYYMPERTGLEVLSQIHERWPDVELGLMSGRGDLTLATSAINQGPASFYLPKPIRRDELTAVLDRCLKEYRQQTAVEEELTRARNESMVDPLTELFNRRYLEADLERLLSLAERHHTPLTIFFIDVNDFKTINDTRGHDVGDRALVAVARWLQSCSRTEDTVGRFAGDEFVILAPLTDPGQAASLKGRLNASPVVLPAEQAGGGRIEITLSIGFASFPEDGGGAQALLQAADQAMYVVKRATKDARGKAAVASAKTSGMPVVLFVDDEEQVRTALSRQMRAQPFTSLFAADAKEGLALIREHPDIACVVSDLKMPGMDGVEFLSQVSETFPHIGCLLMTAHGDFQSATAAVNRAHVQGILAKPWDKAELLSSIRRAIGPPP